MTWNGAYTYVNGSVYADVNFNAYWRDNLRHLKGIGELFTVRDKRLLTPGIRFDNAFGELSRAYSSGGVTYRFFAEHSDSPAIATGDKLRLVGVVRATETGDEEELGAFEVVRTAASTGTLAYYPYRNGARATAPAFFLDPSGKVFIGKNSGLKALDVAGVLRATGFRVGGSSIGQWTLNGTRMEFTGNAEVSGQIEAKNEQGGGAPFDVQSTTKVANLNAAKLQGYGWPTSAQASTAGIVINASEGPEDWLSIPVTRPGWHAVFIQASMPVTTSGNLPALVVYAGSYSNSAWSDVVGDVLQVSLVARVLVLTGQSTISVQVRVLEQPSGTVSGSASALWLSTGTVIYPAGLRSSATFGTATVTVT